MWDRKIQYFPFVIFLTIDVSLCRGFSPQKVEIFNDENTHRPEATIPQGRIRGINMVTHHNRTIFGFVGIPYAQPPVGNLRFKAPVPALPWNGTLDASKEVEPCPQLISFGKIIGKEDCLHLNVFTPQLPTSNDSRLLPVMVYIIGGDFRRASNPLARYGPDFLLDKDVILVIPNFRVGVLGFLSTGDEVSPGNYGLKDVLQALRWIQSSIQYFGGDPDQVTLVGGSTGALMAQLLVLSDSTNGLIHRYIVQSGTVVARSVNHPKEDCAKRATQLGEYLGCPTNTSTLLVECLRGFNASQLVDTDPAFYVWKEFPGDVWSPTTEPDIEGALFTEIPAKLLETGKMRDLPWLSSVNRNEGLVRTTIFYKDPELFEDFLENVDIALPLILGYYNRLRRASALTTAIKSYYLNDLTANRSVLLANLTDLIGDALFYYPTYRVNQQNLVRAKNPVYLCSFDYRSTLSHTYLLYPESAPDLGTSHGDEVIYLFEDRNRRLGPSDFERSEDDWKMVDTMVQLWTSFAINGIPIVADATSDIIWEPYSSMHNYLRIGNRSDPSIGIGYDLHIERMRFWDRLFDDTFLGSIYV